MGKNNGVGVQEGISRIKLIQVNLNNVVKLAQFEKPQRPIHYGLKITALHLTAKV